MHVSPFQKISGEYTFNMGFTPEKFSMRIDYRDGQQGVLATLDGSITNASDTTLAYAALRRPFGAMRVLTLTLAGGQVMDQRCPFLRASKTAINLGVKTRCVVSKTNQSG